jgi:hypothetical protein
VSKGGGKFISENGKLNCALLGSELLKVRGHAGNFSLRDKGTGAFEGHLTGSINR